MKSFGYAQVVSAAHSLLLGQLSSGRFYIQTRNFSELCPNRDQALSITQRVSAADMGGKSYTKYKTQLLSGSLPINPRRCIEEQWPLNVPHFAQIPRMNSSTTCDLKGKLSIKFLTWLSQYCKPAPPGFVYCRGLVSTAAPATRRNPTSMYGVGGYSCFRLYGHPRRPPVAPSLLVCFITFYFTASILRFLTRT